MGCGPSKIEQDESLARCKERKLLMRAAVVARNAFAAAHSAYAVSLKNTGAALSDYAHAELPQSISSSASNSTLAPSASNPISIPPPVESLPPPPPPLPEYSALQRSVSMPDIPLPHSGKKSNKQPVDASIREEDDEEDDEDDEEEEEEVESLSKTKSQRRLNNNPIPPTVAATAQPPPPPPPPPPAVEQVQPTPKQIQTTNPAPLPPMQGSNVTTWDYFFFGTTDSIPPHLGQPDEPAWNELPRQDDVKEEKINKSTVAPPVIPQVVEVDPRPPPLEKVPEPEPPVKVAEALPPKQAKKVKPVQPAGGNGSSGGAGGGGFVHHQHATSVGGGSSESSKKGRMVVAGSSAGTSGSATVNLLQVIDKLDDHFLKASGSAQDVCRMLEAARMHYHSNFAGSRGHIDHSKRIMQVITWNRSFKGLPSQQDDVDDMDDNDESESHAAILDKMLAWEKKLYDEVKAGEIMKIDYQRKVSLLNKQKKRNVRPEVLEKTKAEVSHLHTRYIVDMQSLDSTVSEINHLRDDHLYPKLVELVDGMENMWKLMYEHHRAQLKITQDYRAPFEISLTPRETTPEHYRQTNQLHRTVKELHTQLEKLMEHQKEYIKSLNGWLKLNLIPIESTLKEKVSSPPREVNPPIKYLLHAWHDQLGKLPLELAKSAIHSFGEVISTIIVLQTDELSSKRRWEDLSRDLERKKRQFDDWSRKYMEKRASLGEDAAGQGGGENPNQDPVVEKRFQVEQLEIRVKEEQDNHWRLCKQVREKSIGSLRTQLPGLFHSMSHFSRASAEMYTYLFSITQAQEQVLD